MRVLLALVCLLTATVLLGSCAHETRTPAEPGGSGTTGAALGVGGTEIFSIGWTPVEFPAGFGYIDYMRLDPRTGSGTVSWSLPFDQDYPDNFQTPVGLTYDLNGDMYVLVNYFDSNFTCVFSRLGRVDHATGTMTHIGANIPGMGWWGPDIDSNGILYSTSSVQTEDPRQTGAGYLYRIDKYTGVATRVGADPPTPMYTDYMDLAFDSQDRLWTTTKNKLFRFDQPRRRRPPAEGTDRASAWEWPVPMHHDGLERPAGSPGAWRLCAWQGRARPGVPVGGGAQPRARTA